MKGYVENNGHAVIFRPTTAAEVQDAAAKAVPTASVNISGGPLSYQYTVDHVAIHFGRQDTSGSEHTIDGIAFPGEVSVATSISSCLIKNALRSYKNVEHGTKCTNVSTRFELAISIACPTFCTLRAYPCTCRTFLAPKVFGSNLFVSRVRFLCPYGNKLSAFWRQMHRIQQLRNRFAH